jgi:hypothetical protein
LKKFQRRIDEIALMKSKKKFNKKSSKKFYSKPKVFNDRGEKFEYE